MSKILVIGTGAWGTTLANILLKNKHTVNMYGVDTGQLEDLKQGYNRDFFRNAKLHRIPHLVTNEFASAIENIEYILISIPSKFIQPTLEKYKHLIKPNVVIINSSKGIDSKTGKNYFELIREILPNNHISAIVGPSFAIEVFHNQYTIVNVICTEFDIAKNVCKLFNSKKFKTVPITDDLGSSIFSALKNGLAVGCGILYGYNTSINTIAAVITLGIQEIEQFYQLKGGKDSTALQYCAIGDIYLTCSDNKSRNFRFGELISKIGIKDAIDENTFTVEGLEVIKDIHHMIKNKPNFVLFNTLYEIISGKLDSTKFVDKIWSTIK